MDISATTGRSGDLPVAVIGAGPVGLAAAAHLIRRNLPVAIFEQGATAGSAVRAWGHVRVFTPWSFLIDGAARELLRETGWDEPDPQTLPTGTEIVARYLVPLAAHPAIARALRLRATVTAVTRRDRAKIASAGREEAPFAVRWRDGDGVERRTMARAVIDASGTWSQPNPMGADGLPVPGEREAGERVAHGIPDVLGADRAAYAGRRVLVVGGGHSAINVALDLLALRREVPQTTIRWALREASPARLFGGGGGDALPARGALGLAARDAVASGDLTMLAPFAAEAITPAGGGLRVAGRQGESAMAFDVDQIIVATGFRPDVGMLRELRVTLDPIVEAPPRLAPLIDPNLHSCGTVPPHGAAELAHPEPGLYIAGMKSYGRAPTFLMATGYEQVRSIAAELAGDHAAAREVRLALPETGVCITDSIAGGAATAYCGAPEPAQSSACCAAPAPAASGCCGGPAPVESSACCADDAAAKAAGKGGCGCGTPEREAAAAETV